MSILRRERRSWAPEPIVSPFPGVNLYGAGSNVSMEGALQVSAVWACVRLLADSVSMMPLQGYTVKDGSRTPLPSTPFLMQPSADATMPDWLYMLMVSALLRGNAFGRVVRRDAMGYPVQIELVSPDDVFARVDRTTGQVVYRLNGVAVDRSEIFHFKAYRFPGSPMGLSPIQYASRSIQTDAAVADFAYGYFRDGVHPTSVYESDQQINEDQARTIKERITSAVKGREPLVLGAGLHRIPVSVSPEESQFLATQKYGVAEIARIFGVPPEMIAAEAGNALTYANVEQRALDFLTYSVMPWLTRIEAALYPLMPGNKHVRFDTSVLVRTDLETTMKASAIGIASKQMTPDEARALRDVAPLTQVQKDELDLVPLTVTPTGGPKSLPGAPPVGEGADPATDALASLTSKESPA